MAFEEIIKHATEESMNGTRTGDTVKEVNAIQSYIRNAEKIIVPNKNGIKVKVINKVLSKYNLPKAKYLKINTNSADSSRYPAIAKGLMAVDQTDADVIIARGRLGLPGSGSLLIFMDNKGRILTSGSSPSHAVSKINIEKAVYNETVEALEKIGFVKEY